MAVITIDVGATRVESGFGGWDEYTDPLCVAETPGSPNSLLRLLRGHTEELVSVARSSDEEVLCAAVGMPGWVDGDGRLVESPHTSFEGVNAAEELPFGFPLFVENDANAQGMGSAGGTDTVCYVSLGTGVGGAIVDSGRLIEGDNGFAGEVGHIPVGASDRHCPCGKQGCLGTVASGESLREDLGDSWWQRDLSRDEETRLVEAGEAVGEAASILAALNDPSRVVVSGHLTTHTGFVGGMRRSWSHTWTDCSVETVEETWGLARDGLTRLARRRLRQ